MPGLGSQQRQIASSTLWQLGSQAAMAVLSVLAAKFVAVGLSKELTGYYNSAYGFLQVFAIIADFGLYAVSVREMSTSKEPSKTLGALLVLRSIIIVISLGAAVAVAWALPMWRGTPFPTGVAIASLVPFFTLLAGVLRTVFQIQYKMKYVFVAEVLQRVLTTVGIGFFILMGARLSNDVRLEETFLWIGGAGAFLLFAVSWAYASRLMPVRPCFDRTVLMRMLKLAAPYGIAYLLMSLYRQLDVVFIALLRPDFAVQNASYGFAGRVEDMAFLIPTFLLNSVLPILTRKLAAKEDVRELLGKTFFILLLTGSVFLFFGWLWARPLTLLFATHAYLSVPGHPGSDMAFALMSLPMFLNGLVLFSFYVFLAENAWKRLALNFGVAVILTITLNLLWTKSLGFVGAASALIVVHLFLTAMLLPQTLRIHPIRLGRREVLQWIAFSAVLAAILALSAPFMTSMPRTVIGGALMIPVMGLLAYLLGIHAKLRAGSETTEIDTEIEPPM